MSNCIVCGNPITLKSVYKPRIYCSSNCGDYMKFKDTLERKILLINPTDEARSLIRGDMFRLSNILSKRTFTKGAF